MVHTAFPLSAFWTLAEGGALVKRTVCPECDAEVIECDNAVWLDYPAQSYDEIKAPWTIMPFAEGYLASVGNPSPLGTGHSLHEHQPAESVMAR